MFRLWGKLWKDGRMVKDTVASENDDDTRTHKVFRALDEICREFDLSRPIWLEQNISEFKRQSKTKFHQDSFIEEVEFDALEIQVLEED